MKSIRDLPIKIIHEIPPVLSSKEKCAIDTEWFLMDKDRLHRPVLTDGSPNGFLACVTFCFNGEDVYFVTNPDDVQEAMDNVSEATQIYANCKFDLVHLRRHAHIPVRINKLWDVITLDRIMWSGLYSSFTLADITRRRLHMHLPKEDRKDFAKADKLTPELEQYSAYDPVATWHVYQHQIRDVLKNDPNALKLWAEVDLPALNTVMSMKGFKANKNLWYEIADENMEKKTSLQSKYDINLRSAKQVGELLASQGIELPKTAKGNYSTAIKTLEGMEDPNETILDLIELSSLKSKTTTYGRGFMENSVEPDNRIYADFNPLRAATGRFGCSKPNLQNVPNKYTDPRYRECFIAGEGNVLVVGDWSSQEPRGGAYLAQDQTMIDIFNDDKDIYIESARLMFGWELTKDDPRRSHPIKPVVLGAFYGLTKHGLFNNNQIPKDEGEKLLNKFFEVFHGVADWIDEMRDGREYVETIMGRKYWLNPYDYKSRNNACNSPVQGSASDAMKMAGWEFVKQWGDLEHSPIVNFVHDEMIIEVAEEDKDRAMTLLDECMVSVAEKMHPGVKARADIGFGQNWSAKA
ncbi:hypothetical protein HN960_05370 [Candidatus Peregrinibacteria bacterium]|jgi:DNA polymerase I|nr:hypothetical protein [Candidatus Peregrinibacteria bacterium]